MARFKNFGDGVRVQFTPEEEALIQQLDPSQKP